MKLRITQALVGIALSLLPTAAAAQSYTIAPTPFQTALDNSGHIITNACIWTYQAGTTTAAATYADNAGTANLNPIRSDSAGRFTAYLVAGANYKFVYENAPCSDSSHGTVLRTADNIAGVPASAVNLDVTGTAGENLTAGQVVYLSDGSGGKTPAQWYRADNANLYSSVFPALGMVPSTITSGSQGTIRIAGAVTGLSGLVSGGSQYVGTLGALTATQPVFGRRVAVADSPSSVVLVASPLGYPQATTSISTTGNIPSLVLPPSFSNTFIVLMTNASLTTIQGIAAGQVGQRVLIFSTGAGQVDLAYLSGSAATGDKLLNFATSGVTSLSPGVGSAEYVYDNSQRWRLVAHNQGDFISWSPAFSTSTAATWTAVSSNGQKYLLNGRQLTVVYEFLSSTISAVAVELRFTLPSTFTSAMRTYNYAAVKNNGGARATGTVLTALGEQFTRCYVDLTEATNWVAGVTNNDIRGILTVNVQ